MEPPKINTKSKYKFYKNQAKQRKAKQSKNKSQIIMNFWVSLYFLCVFNLF